MCLVVRRKRNMSIGIPALSSRYKQQVPVHSKYNIPLTYTMICKLFVIFCTVSLLCRLNAAESATKGRIEVTIV